MNSFKDIAYRILEEFGKPLHSKEITKIALQRGWLKTAGKTPEATMNAQLVVDINSKKETDAGNHRNADFQGRFSGETIPHAQERKRKTRRFFTLGEGHPDANHGGED